MPKFNGLTPMVDVLDLKRTIDFYRDRLGFDCVATFPDDEPFWCRMQRDGASIMFNLTHTHGPDEEHDHEHPPPGMTGCLYMYVDDVDALWESIAAGFPDAPPPQDRPYGMRDVAVTDPDGYVLVFGSQIPPT